MNNKNILHQIPSEKSIKHTLRKLVFGRFIFCPICHTRQVKKSENRYRCKLCRKPFSLTSVIPWLKGLKLPLQEFWLILWCWISKVPVDQTVRISGRSEVTVRRWFNKFRDNLPQDLIDSIRLETTVQIDEAYRKGYAIIGAKEEKRGEKNKESKIVLKVLPKTSVDRKDIITFMTESIIPDSNLNSDGAAIYRGIGNWWPVNHKFEIHKKWEFTLTSEIEGIWANLFTFIRRMYHHVTKDKIEGLVKEFSIRYMYPDLFLTPNHFLEVSIYKINYQPRSQGKPKVENNIMKNANQILQTKTYELPSIYPTI